MSDANPEAMRWRRCSACKKDIRLGAGYWVCNVSTCNRKRTALAFCSVECWEVHLPEANHRESWAIEKRAPLTPESPPATKPAVVSTAPRRRIVSDPPARRSLDPAPDLPREILVVSSRLKEYIRAKSGFNTSLRVLGPLSDIIRKVCDQAIRNAEKSERKTVLDRDIPSP